MITQGTENNFNELVKDGLVLVQFYADWCGPCKMLSPVVEEVAKDNADLNVVKVNVDEQGVLASQFGVRSIPTLVLFKGGKVVSQTMGYQAKPMLEQFINQAK